MTLEKDKTGQNFFIVAKTRWSTLLYLAPYHFDKKCQNFLNIPPIYRKRRGREGKINKKRQ